MTLYLEHIQSALAGYRVELALTELQLWQHRLARMTAAGWQICFPVGDENQLAVAVTLGNWSVRRAA